MRYLPLILIPMCACSAKYWGGEAAGELPGVHVKAPGLFSRGEFSVTADCQAEFDKLHYGGATTTQASSLSVEGFKYGQQPSLDLPFLPPIILATTELQRSQAEYAKVWATAITDIVDRISNVVSILGLAKVKSTTSGMTLELPGGLKIGGQKVTSPGDLTNYLNALQSQLAQLKANPPIEKPQ